MFLVSLLQENNLIENFQAIKRKCFRRNGNQNKKELLSLKEWNISNSSVRRQTTKSCDVYTFDTIGILSYISAESQLPLLFFILKEVINRHRIYTSNIMVINKKTQIRENQPPSMLSDCLATPMGIFVSLYEFRFRV